MPNNSWLHGNTSVCQHNEINGFFLCGPVPGIRTRPSLAGKLESSESYLMHGEMRAEKNIIWIFSTVKRWSPRGFQLFWEEVIFIQPKFSTGMNQWAEDEWEEKRGRKKWAGCRKYHTGYKSSTINRDEDPQLCSYQLSYSFFYFSIPSLINLFRNLETQ